MLDNIKKGLFNYKIIIANFGYLSLLRILTLALPLATYPYLIRVLSAGVYGKVVFAQAAMAYFSIVINYGFNISATKDVAANVTDKKALSKIVSSVFTAKILLWLSCFLILIILIFTVNVFKSDKLLYLLSFGVCFNELLFQQFFFQGIEKMKYITIVNGLSRVVFFIFIFILVKGENDYLMVPFLNFCGAFIGGIVALYIILKKEKIRIKFPGYKLTFVFFKESTPFFLSRFSSVIINNSNTLLLGGFVGYTEVALYDLGQKILSVLLIPFDIINQATYPFVARTRNMRFVKKLILFVFIATVVIYLLTILIAPWFVNLLGGVELQPALPIVYILGVNIILTSQTYFYGNTILVVNNKSKYFNLSVIYTSFFYLLINGFLVISGSISIYTMAMSSVSSEAFCFLYRRYYVSKFKFLK